MWNIDDRHTRFIFPCEWHRKLTLLVLLRSSAISNLSVTLDVSVTEINFNGDLGSFDQLSIRCRHFSVTRHIGNWIRRWEIPYPRFSRYDVRYAAVETISWRYLPLSLPLSRTRHRGFSRTIPSTGGDCNRVVALTTTAMTLSCYQPTAVKARFLRNVRRVGGT